MPIRYLRSKTRPPRLHEDSVKRPRLSEVLAEGDRPLWLISAPAGYGKSTAVVQALDRFDGRVGWVSIDRVDNDPIRFWTHVAAALLEGSDGFDGFLERVDPDQLDQFVDELVADVESRQDRTVLVLDDLHEITNPDITDSLARILNHPPPNLTVAIATRADPALPIGRLRSQGRLLETRAADLAFDADEAAELLGPGLDRGAVSNIVASTEGWPTALRMLAVSSTAARSADLLIEAASESGPDLADFLAAEALGVQRPPVQQFLIETSILADLNPALCDAVTGRPGSLTVLRELARGQVFTELVEPATNTFRYHPLFRDFLRSAAEELGKEDLEQLHRRAARWFTDEGDPTPAIRHNMAAGESEAALAVITTHWVRYSHDGLLATVLDWLEMYGLDQVRASTTLRYAVAWAHLNARRYEAMDEWLGDPVVGDGDDLNQMLAERHTIESHRARHLGDLERAVAEAEAAVALIPDPENWMSTVVNAPLALTQLLAGRSPHDAATASINIGVVEQVDSSIVIGYSCLAYTASLDEDRLDEAEALADQAMAFVTSPILERFHQPALALLAKAQVAAARGLVSDATELLDRAEAIGQAAVEPLLLVLIHCRQARLEHLQGRFDEARARLRQAEHAASDRAGDHLDDVIRRTRNDIRFAAVDEQHLPPGAVDLSVRELAVLQLLPHRLARKELAAQLHVSENTIKTHLASIRHKLGVTGRADIVARARELDLLPAEG